MKLRRILRAGLALLATLIVVAVALLLWLYVTPSGARFVLERAIAAADGSLVIGDFAGSFSDELVLTDVRYRDARAEAEIDRLSLRVGLSGLFSRMLVIEDLQSSTVRYRQLEVAAPDAAPGAATESPVALPLTIRLNRASIEGIALALDDRRLDFERITLSGIVDDTSAFLQRFEIRFMGFFISLQGGLTWADGLVIDGLVSWSGEFRDQQWLGSADVAGRWPRLNIEQEMLEPIVQTARGNLLLSAAPAFDLSIDWAGLGEATVAGGLDPATATWRAMVAASDLDLRAFVPGLPGLWSANGNLNARLGDGFRIDSEDLRIEGTLGEESLLVDFSGAFSEPSTLQIERLVATLDANRAEVSGTLGSVLDLGITAELDDLAALASLAAREDIPALNAFAEIAATLSGQATADLTVTGDPAAPRVTGGIRLGESSYADLPLALAVDFATPAANEQVITIGSLDATLGASRVTGRGSMGAGVLRLPGSDSSAIDLDFVLAATLADLAELVALAERDDVRALLRTEPALAGLRGQAEADLTVQGSLNRIDINADLSATEIQYGELSLASATAQAEFGLYEGATANLTLAATAAPGSARLAADGTIAAGQWTGALRSLDIDEQWLGAWTLTAPARFAIGAGQIDLANACLAHADSGICAEWRFGSQSDRLHIRAEEFELGVLNPLLPTTVTLDGRLSLEANLDSPFGAPMGTLSASGQGIGIAFTMSETDRVTTTLESLALNASLTGFALNLEAGIVSQADGRADVAMATADFRDPDAAISGRLAIAWPDLAALTVLSPDVGEVGGTLAMSANVGGTFANPILDGSAEFDNGHVAIPAWGLLIDRIEGEAMSPDGNSLEYRGTGFIEDSEIRLSGATEFDPSGGWPTRLSIVGDNVPIASRPDARILASPDFDVTIDLPRIEVSGRVFVPEAEISVEELPSQAVKVSPDSVVHGGAVSEAIRPLEMIADVTVELGDAVRYTGSNLDTDLSGALRLQYQSGLSPTASGSLTLAGRYDAYGQTLGLERGELLFAGPLDDPAVDVLAVRRIGATAVGIRLSGTLLTPVASLFSEPQMSEANALSYLMFGRPLSSSDNTETATLQSTALALGLQQALPVVQRVGETLGLDELSIEPTEVDAGALMAGKYLSPKVYMSYSYGLFNRLGGFLLRYQFNDRLSLETRSGDEKSMDLLYSIEKD